MTIEERLAELEAAAALPGGLTLRLVARMTDGQPNLRRALEAAAVPHWWDNTILNCVLEDDLARDATAWAERLRQLSVVEPFTAKPNTSNVHEVTRLALRDQLRREGRLAGLSAGALRAFPAPGTDSPPSYNIEHLYHLLSAEPETGAEALENIYQLWKNKALWTPLLDLAAMLDELLPYLEAPTRARALYRRATILRDSRPIDEIEVQVKESLELFNHQGNERAQAQVLGFLGDLSMANNNLSDASLRYSQSKSIRERLAASDPANVKAQRDLSVSIRKLGDLAAAQRDPATALRYYSESKDVIERLANNDPDNANWQRDLSLLLEKLGNIQFSEGEDVKRKASNEPGNIVDVRDKSESLEQSGDLAVANGDLDLALHSFTESKLIRERLAATDPTNVAWQRDVYASQIKLGILNWATNDLEAANSSFTESRIIAELLAIADPANAEWHYDLCVSLVRLGYIAVAQGKLTEAINFFKEEGELWITFKNTHGKYDGWERAPAQVLRKLGNPDLEKCDLTGALNHYKMDKEIDKRLDLKDHENILWLQEQSRLLEEIGDVVLKNELWPGALSCLNLCKTIEKKISSNDNIRIIAIEEKRKPLIKKCGHLIHKLKAKDTTGRWAYYFVLVFTPNEKAFMDAIVGDGTIDLEDFGEVVASCYGEEPNQEVKDYLKKEYDFNI